MKRRAVRLTAIGGGLLCALSLLAPAQQDLSEFEKRLEKIQVQVKDLKAKIQAEQSKESSILTTLHTIGLTKNLLRKELSGYNVQLEKTNAELAALRGRIQELRSDLEREKKSIERTLVTLYKFGRVDLLHFILQVESVEVFSAESKRLTVLARHQEKAVSAFLLTLADLNSAESGLEAKRDEIRQISRNAEAKRAEIEAEEQKNRTLVAEIQKSRKSYEQALGELNESSNQLQIMMKRIASQEYALPSPFIPLDERKGKLPWPLKGRVITRFGRQKHPQFNTMTMNNGIEIARPKDTSVIQAVHAGRVVYADAFEGYGNLLIIDHGMTYFSLYGHCSDFLVNKGDLVREGQPVAVVGDSGSLKGECLYFEIRFKTKALDPLQWLKRR